MYDVRFMYDVIMYDLIIPLQDGVTVDFEQKPSQATHVIPKTTTSEGFAATGRRLNTLNNTDDVRGATTLFSDQIAVALQN